MHRTRNAPDCGTGSRIATDAATVNHGGDAGCRTADRGAFSTAPGDLIVRFGHARIFRHARAFVDIALRRRIADVFQVRIRI